MKPNVVPAKKLFKHIQEGPTYLEKNETEPFATLELVTALNTIFISN